MKLKALFLSLICVMAMSFCIFQPTEAKADSITIKNRSSVPLTITVLDRNGNFLTKSTDIGYNTFTMRNRLAGQKKVYVAASYIPDGYNLFSFSLGSEYIRVNTSDGPQVFFLLSIPREITIYDQEKSAN